jgi:hypothetical protein
VRAQRTSTEMQGDHDTERQHSEAARHTKTRDREQQQQQQQQQQQHLLRALSGDMRELGAQLASLCTEVLGVHPAHQSEGALKHGALISFAARWPLPLCVCIWRVPPLIRWVLSCLLLFVWHLAPCLSSTRGSERCARKEPLAISVETRVFSLPVFPVPSKRSSRNQPNQSKSCDLRFGSAHTQLLSLGFRQQILNDGVVGLEMV